MDDKYIFLSFSIGMKIIMMMMMIISLVSKHLVLLLLLFQNHTGWNAIDVHYTEIEKDNSNDNHHQTIIRNQEKRLGFFSSRFVYRFNLSAHTRTHIYNYVAHYLFFFCFVLFCFITISTRETSIKVVGVYSFQEMECSVVCHHHSF